MAAETYYRVVLGVCNHRHIQESRLSDCDHGCKYYICRECRKEVVVHHSGYGCTKETDWSSFA